MRKQIGLRMKDETRDQLERVRGGLSRTDYVEGAVLAQIARDLKKTEPKDFDTPDCNFSADISPAPTTNDWVAVEETHYRRLEAEHDAPDTDLGQSLKDRGLPNGFAVRSSAESKAGVLPVPKKAQKGRK